MYNTLGDESLTVDCTSTNDDCIDESEGPVPTNITVEEGWSLATIPGLEM